MHMPLLTLTAIADKVAELAAANVPADNSKMRNAVKGAYSPVPRVPFPALHAVHVLRLLCIAS